MKYFQNVVEESNNVFDDFISDLVAELEKIWKLVVELKDTDDLNQSVYNILDEIDKLIDKLS